MTLFIVAVNVQFLDEAKMPRPDKTISLTIVPAGLKPIVLGKIPAGGSLAVELDNKEKPHRCAIVYIRSNFI